MNNNVKHVSVPRPPSKCSPLGMEVLQCWMRRLTSIHQSIDSFDYRSYTYYYPRHVGGKVFTVPRAERPAHFPIHKPLEARVFRLFTAPPCEGTKRRIRLTVILDTFYNQAALFRLHPLAPSILLHHKEWLYIPEFVVVMRAVYGCMGALAVMMHSILQLHFLLDVNLTDLWTFAQSATDRMEVRPENEVWGPAPDPERTERQQVMMHAVQCRPEHVTATYPFQLLSQCLRYIAPLMAFLNLPLRDDLEGLSGKIHALTQLKHHMDNLRRKPNPIALPPCDPCQSGQACICPHDSHNPPDTSFALQPLSIPVMFAKLEWERQGLLVHGAAPANPPVPPLNGSRLLDLELLHETREAAESYRDLDDFIDDD